MNFAKNWNQIPAQGSKMEAVARKCDRQSRLMTGRHAGPIRSRWNISPLVTRRPPKQQINSFETPSKGIFDMIPISGHSLDTPIVLYGLNLPIAFYRMKLASAVPLRGSVTDHGQFGLYNIGLDTAISGKSILWRKLWSEFLTTSRDWIVPKTCLSFCHALKLPGTIEKTDGESLLGSKLVQNRKSIRWRKLLSEISVTSRYRITL